MIRTIFTLALLIATVLYAQEPPAWLPMGNLDRADKIWTFLEIPGTSIILAAGRADRDEAAVWRSTDGGQSWSRPFHSWYSVEGVRELAFDANRNIIFACISNITGSYLEYDPLWYSTDLGESWASVAIPTNWGPRAGIHSIALYDNKLYVVLEEVRTENGNYWGIYSGMLYRLDISSADPNDWTWEFVMQYPELNYLVRLAVNNGKLFVFGKDYDRDAIRIFTHSLQELNAKATTIGTVGHFKEQIEALKHNAQQVPAEINENNTKGDLQ